MELMARGFPRLRSQILFLYARQNQSQHEQFVAQPAAGVGPAFRLLWQGRRGWNDRFVDVFDHFVAFFELLLEKLQIRFISLHP